MFPISTERNHTGATGKVDPLVLYSQGLPKSWPNISGRACSQGASIEQKAVMIPLHENQTPSVQFAVRCAIATYTQPLPENVTHPLNPLLRREDGEEGSSEEGTHTNAILQNNSCIHSRVYL